MWLALIFTIPSGIIPTIINAVALILTDKDIIRDIEEIENGKEDHTS
jgi:hypothetical protein